MEVSEQIIQVLDAVCDKLGVVIDWSQKNVLPYAQDLLRRIVLLEVLTSVVWILVLGGTAFFIARIISKIINAWRVDDVYFKTLCDDEFLDTIFCFLGGIAFGVLVALVIAQVFDIVKCIAMPELILIEFAQSLAGG